MNNLSLVTIPAVDLLRALREDIFRAIVGAVCCFLFASGSAEAGKYVLEKGSGDTVCKAYGDNLNALMPDRALGCGERGRSVSPDIVLPNWEPLLSLDDYAELLPKIWQFSWNRDVNQASFHDFRAGEWQGSNKQQFKAYQRYDSFEDQKGAVYGNPLASIDIDNDGVPENIYLDQRCVANGATLLVLNADRSDVDKKKTNLLAQHPSWKNRGLPPYRKPVDGEFIPSQPAELTKRNLMLTDDAFRDVDYSVFVFEGKSYFDLWWRDSSDFSATPDYATRRLRVFIAEKGKVREVCSYRFDFKN